MKNKTCSYQIIEKDNYLVLNYKTDKVNIDICECNKNSDKNDYNNWNPCNLSKRQGYAWLFNDRRPYGKFIKKGFLFNKKNREFIVDFISIKDDHFNNGYKDWVVCEHCSGKGCSKCNFNGEITTNVVHDNYCDHIVVIKSSTYDKNSILKEHTIININNKLLVNL